MASWLFFLCGLTSRPTGLRWLFASGVALGLSMASRMPFVAYAVLPATVFGFQLLAAVVRRRPASGYLAQAMAFGGPLAATLLALLLYNQARFDFPFEFGLRYILQGSADFYDLVRQPDNTLASQFSLRLSRRSCRSTR